jgi:hypothetical protein
MNHLSEEQLILHYYGEESDALSSEKHLEECAGCRDLYSSLQRVLNVVDALPVPELGPEYGAEVWRRIQHRVPVRRRWLPTFEWRWAAATAAMAGLLIAAFVAGRHYPQLYPQKIYSEIAKRQMQLTAATDPQAGERVLLVAVGDYLERSQMVLIELANADPDPHAKLDISSEQERAAGLVSESRLYRQTAEHTGDTAVANVLEELDRVLLDIAHGPSEVSPAELDDLRQKLKAEGILFKIRVLGSNVRTQEKEKPNATGGRQTL